MKTDKYAKLYDDTMNRKEALFADSHARFTAWLNKNESKLANYIDKLLSKAIDKGYSKVRIDFGTTEEWIKNDKVYTLHLSNYQAKTINVKNIYLRTGTDNELEWYAEELVNFIQNNLGLYSLYSFDTGYAYEGCVRIMISYSKENLR